MASHGQRKTRGIGRRQALTAIGGFVGGAMATAHWRRSYAQTAKTVRIWTGQSSPDQMNAYNDIIKGFEAANPGVKVAIELATQDSIWAKLATGFAGGEIADIVTNFNTYVAGGLYPRGLLEPLNDVAQSVGDFTERSLDVYRDKGEQFALAYAQTVISTTWVRTDLLGQAGLAVPKYWDEYASTAKALTKGGVFGTTLPYGAKGMSSRIVDMCIRQSGGDIIAPDGSVAFDGPGTVKALEFLKEMRQYCPTGANSYSFIEQVNAFGAGAAAIGVYTGRQIATVREKNPALEDKYTSAYFPYPKDGVPYWVCGFDALFVPKAPKVNVAEAKAFAKWMYRADNYTKFLHAAPGHNLPVVKSVAASAEYNNHDLLKKKKEAVDRMQEIGSVAFDPIKPTAKHPMVFKMGEIYGSDVMGQVLQRVVVDNEAPKAAAAWGADQIAKIMKA